MDISTIIHFINHFTFSTKSSPETSVTTAAEGVDAIDTYTISTAVHPGTVVDIDLTVSTSEAKITLYAVGL